MSYLVDTDILILAFANDPSTQRLLVSLMRHGVAMSIVSYMEVCQGLLRSSHPERSKEQFRMFITDIPILPFAVSTAERCAELREVLATQGKRVRPRALDLMTAAIALEHGLTLVTRNTHDYDDIPGLSLYEWSS